MCLCLSCTSSLSLRLDGLISPQSHTGGLLDRAGLFVGQQMSADCTPGHTGRGGHGPGGGGCGAMCGLSLPLLLCPPPPPPSLSHQRLHQCLLAVMPSNSEAGQRSHEPTQPGTLQDHLTTTAILPVQERRDRTAAETFAHFAELKLL